VPDNYLLSSVVRALITILCGDSGDMDDAITAPSTTTTTHDGGGGLRGSGGGGGGGGDAAAAAVVVPFPPARVDYAHCLPLDSVATLAGVVCAFIDAQQVGCARALSFIKVYQGLSRFIKVYQGLSRF
jgi:hypothetical protein